MRCFIILAAVLLILPAKAAERSFDFSDFTVNNSPTNFTSLVAGRGRPGEWRVILDEVPPTLAPLTSKTVALTSRAVLAQKAREPLLGHLPMLIFDGDNFREFKFTTRFKLMGGALEEAAGIVFRFQNASNFYFVQASALAGNFKCSKVVDGEIKPPLGPDVNLNKGEWHEMSVQCQGPRITCSLDGHEAIKLVDNASSTVSGKVGFCTQADTVAYFVDARVAFTPEEMFAEKMVRDALKEFSKLVGLKIYAMRGQEAAVVGSGDAKDRGRVGGQMERDVIQKGHTYYVNSKQTVTVVLPLRDHNGDGMAAVSIEMKKYIGQTEDNALVRAQPIVRRLQSQVQSLDDLLQ